MSWFFRLWWLSLFVKILLAAALPLAADEAYYWFWSHHLQWSYFDHPPMIAFFMWLGRPFENFMSAVRIPGVILGHLTLIVWFQILRNKLDDGELRLWAWLSLLTPLIGFGSLVMTPDVPLLLFWSLSLLAFEKALERKSFLWYSALGFSMGLGFSSKYHIVLFVPVLLLYLTFEKRWKEIRFKLIPATVLFGLIGSFPVLYWNATHDWQSFAFQLKHGLGRDHYNIEWTLGYIAGQVVLLGPPLIASFIRGWHLRGLRLFSWNALFVWGFFLFSSFKAVVEANWPLAAFPPAHAVIAAGARGPKWIRATCFFWAAVALLLGSHWVHPWISQGPDKLNETHEYRSLAPYAIKYEPLFANTYQMASLLSFETKRPIYKLYDMSRFDFYDQLPESKPGTSTFYVIRRTGQNLPKWIEEAQTQVEVMEKAEPGFEILRIRRL